ncbi:hypothetical protein ACG1VR_05435 [Cedecea davisae]|uniref:hypothetical protein n=1 Tax=Cedecea davisae TaxID=158484 RepID=UPI00376EF48F
MKKHIPTALLFIVSSCTSNNVNPTEQVLFNKVVFAIKSGDIKKLSEPDYDDVSTYLSNGEARWVELYPKLNKEPFLGITSFQEGLNIAMAYALSVNPSEILKFVNSSNVDYICGIPFIEPTQDEIDSYYLKASAALKKLTSESHWKEKCLSTLTSAMNK